jgi:hypothetical protein
MRIQLYDRGSPKGKKLFSDLEVACKRLQIDYDPEYIKDMTRAYAMGVQGNTILVINNQIALVDKYPPVSELTDLIAEYQD